MKQKNSFAKTIRLIARISGSFLVAFTAIFGIATFIDSLGNNTGSPLSTLILIIFAIWVIALSGLVIALWKEGLGGFISLVSFIVMCILNMFNRDAPDGKGAIIIFVIFSIPSLFYIYYWWLTKSSTAESR
jgi:cytochrome bd-type quinol oxidase subunit 2